MYLNRVLGFKVELEPHLTHDWLLASMTETFWIGSYTLLSQHNVHIFQHYVKIIRWKKRISWKFNYHVKVRNFILNTLPVNSF